METQNTVNLLNSSENEFSKLATKQWYVIDSDSKGNYSHKNPIKFFTKSIESSLCDYSDAYISVTRNIAVTGDEFLKNEIKKLEKENEELRKENNYLKKISKRCLELKFEKYNSIKSKCLKCIVKKIPPTLQKWLSMINIMLNQNKTQNT